MCKSFLKESDIVRKLLYVFIALCAIFFPSSALAMEDGISTYLIDATVLENGDLKVKELFVLEGSFNGYERVINYRNAYAPTFDNTINSLSGSSLYNGSGITIDEVRAVNDSEISFDLLGNGEVFSLVNSASKGDYGVYTMEETANGVKLLIYNPSKKNNRGFYVEYTLKNLGIVHNDIAEIGWNMFSTELRENVGHLEARIHIPFNTNLLRGWAHGPLQGEISLVGNDELHLVIDYLKAYEAMDVRFAFDRGILSASSKFSSLEALDAIIAIETDLANEANLERDHYYQSLEYSAIRAVEKVEESFRRDDYDEALKLVISLRDGEVKTDLNKRLDVALVEIEKRENIFRILSFVLGGAWILGLIFLLRYIYSRYDKEYSSDFQGKYYRDFPASYGPSTVGYLLHRGIRNDDLSASILNLIQLKVIGFEKDENSKKADSFILRRLEHSVILNKSDVLLLDFLFGSDDHASLYDLKKKAKKSYQSFIDDFSVWKQQALIEAQNENFYESNPGVRVLSGLYCFVGIFISCIPTYPAFRTILIVMAIIAFIYFVSYTKKTKKGNDDYRKWIGLKNFMLDFGRMNEKELPEIVLWEKYLVYAVTLGCAEKLAKTMKIRIQESNQNGVVLNGPILDYYYLNSMLHFNRVMNQTMNQAISSAFNERSAAIAASSKSSGGGFGGGFSGGGGSFGGGGGGGRF